MKSLDMEEWNYQKRYESLYNNLCGAYADYYALLQIQSCSYVEAKNMVTSLQVNAREKALLLFVRALQSDLCLSITRMYTDQGSNANTFSNLKQFVYRTYQRKCTYKLPKQYSRNTSEITEIICFRNFFLAHTLVEDKEFNIKMSYLEGLLEELRNWLNSLCFIDISTTIALLNNADLEVIKRNIDNGISVLMSLPHNTSLSFL